jgi:FMN phosphatase YigB (HAD superfamily)
LPNSQIRCVVFDFDGTLTNIGEDSKPFEPAYLNAFATAKELGTPEAQVRALWDKVKLDILAHPLDAWTEDFNGSGKAVAPASADPYLMTTAIANRVLDALGKFSDKQARMAFTGPIFGAAYPKDRGTVFRTDAKKVLEASSASHPTFVVTNSAPEAVKSKLSQLGKIEGFDLSHVSGNASKFSLVPSSGAGDDPIWKKIPEKVTVTGLDRPLYLQRGKYYDALRAVWESVGAGPEQMLVCGDIYELDLALPNQLGASIHFVRRDTVFKYEQTAIQAAGPRGSMSDELSGVLARL